MSDIPTSTTTGDPLDAVIAAYLQQVEAGQVPDRAALLAAHADLADRLVAFFADFDRLDHQAGGLRLANDPNAGELPRVRYFGDYELLEVIARGGMGVVYKARQVSLNRVVALKMIAAAELATPQAVARFHIEAESAANLDHPNIVPIYEVGEQEKQCYYAMRYIEGPALGKQSRGDARGEARRLAVIARAVHHAHQRGVLHRDLKPSNILIDAAGEPHLSDFGLAKRLDSDRSLTETGLLVGTPRYMAPEQASGRKDLTVTADVYSLGVVLYERLTGRTPFLGETVLEVLRQVRESEPPRPSSVVPGLSRDLETICLKCLEKEPTKRYSSADALADDLERWCRGEPILARPVGQAERLWRLCRRNPAVASLTVLVALVLVLATTVSSGLAAWALGERDRADARTKDVERVTDDQEQALARSLLRPLDPNANEDDDPKEQEYEALWEMTHSETGRLGLRFLKEATRTPLSTRQFCARAESSLIAAVGPNRQKRSHAVEILLPRLFDPNMTVQQRADVALATKYLDDLPDAFSLIRAEVLSQALAQGPNKWSVADLARELSSVAGRLGPVQAQRLCSPAAQALAEGLRSEADVMARSVWANGLALAVGCLQPAEATQILAESLGRETEADARRLLAISLAATAGRLGQGFTNSEV